jgi:hypothetical protein
MTGGGKAVLFFVGFAAAVVLAAGPRIASAQAAGPPQPPDLAAGITEYANAEVDAAMAESAAVVSQVTDVPSAAPTPTAAPTPAAVVQTTSLPQTTSQPTEDTTARSASIGVPSTAVGAGPIELLVTPEPTPPAPLAGGAGWPLNIGPVVQHDLERSSQKSKPKAVTRASRSTVSRSAFLRVELRTSATATAETSSSSASAMARSSVHSSEQSSGSSGRSQRPAAPKAPLPFPPFPPNAPAPNSGASQTGGGGGQGALLIFFVPLAALVIFGIHRLLRRVHWSGLRMPRRGAALPWRPG